MISTSNSLQRKLLVVMLITTLTAVVVSLGAMTAHALRSYHEGWTNIVSTQADLLGHTVASALAFDDAKVASENLSVLKFLPQIRSAAVYNARGALFATYSANAETARFPPLPEADDIRVEQQDVIVFKRIIDKGEILGTIFIRARYGLRARILEYAEISAIVMLAAMLVAYFVSLRMQRIVTRPILAMAKIAREIVERGDYSRRAEKVSDDEVGMLASSFNGMLDEIERRTLEIEASNLKLAEEVTERIRNEEEVTRLNAELESRVRHRTAQLEAANQELEAFCYSVSHDLRSPLRAIDGFSQALIEDLPEIIPEEGLRYLDRIRSSVQRMGQLIEDLLNLSRVSRGTLEQQTADLSAIAKQVVSDLRQRDPDRRVDVSVWDGMSTLGDARLLRAMFENLIGNAWKFTSRTENAQIEIGALRDRERVTYFVRDNGAGFDMAYADKLFGAFQRLHSANEFQGTGIGLATVQRIVHRHGGRIWADARVGAGAVFFFTLEVGAGDSLAAAGIESGN